ncbi:MAG TPA: alkaline phosphatase [Rhodocyclaceae bacterium]|nr:alkaline phosphatase [Rhodocyclaceae bacterium]
MKYSNPHRLPPSLFRSAVILAGIVATPLQAAPSVSRLTPPSELFSSGRPAPVIARFLPGQRFDLQATLRPDSADKTIVGARFVIDGKPVDALVALRDCSVGCLPDIAKNAAIASVRAVSVERPGIHTFSVTATQSDGQTVVADGNFEVASILAGGRKVKNIVIILGDGMGASQRTAARIVGGGYAQGKTIAPLAMDTFPVVGLVKTASLNSIVTDSSPGMTSYVSGNKNNNNEEGVFPDDTTDFFDNPRIEYLSEYLHRVQGKALGVVTTADVFDSTPAGNAVHTSNRRAGTGIVDQFFDDRRRTGLTVLMGGGRKWFLPASQTGSARSESNDYAFSAGDAHSAEIVNRWGAAAGKIDIERDLLAEFQAEGFRYAADKTALDAIDPAKTDRLLGLFSLSNMNVALDKIDGRRNKPRGLGSGGVVDDYGFPDQPMLDEMVAKALAVLERQKNGFVLLVEGASIDKQAHTMDTERWMLDTLELDRAVKVVQEFARRRGDTLAIVTADHECSGAALIGGSIVSDVKLQELARAGGEAHLRDKVVGPYEKAGFPRYRIAADGYPETTNIDRRLLIGYGANADRYEDWRTNERPVQDKEHPFLKQPPLAAHPISAKARDTEGRFLVTGQVPGDRAVHTGTDIPLSAYGPGAWSFTGVFDNTDVFFRLAQAALGGVVTPDGLSPLKPTRRTR